MHFVSSQTVANEPPSDILNIQTVVNSIQPSPRPTSRLFRLSTRKPNDDRLRTTTIAYREREPWFF